MLAPRSRTATTLRRSLTCLGLAALVSLTACDKGSSEDGAGKDGAGKDAIEQAVAAGAGEAGGPSAAEVRTFLKDQRKLGCEMLPPALVAKQFAVPEAELKQMKIAGCIYSWDAADESEILEASIMMISVHDDAAKARKRFDNATRSLTAEEIRAQMATVMDKTKEVDAIDTKAEEKAVDQLGGAMSAMVPDGGYQYEDVPGVGDAARVLTHDGKLSVLVGNMTFTVGAYKGAPSPPPDMSGIAGDMNKIMAIAKQAETDDLNRTRDVRKQQAIELGKAIVAGL